MTLHFVTRLTRDPSVPALEKNGRQDEDPDRDGGHSRVGHIMKRESVVKRYADCGGTSNYAACGGTSNYAEVRKQTQDEEI